MSDCGSCQHFTLQFPAGFPAYYAASELGRCKFEPLWKFRAPNSGKECDKYVVKEQK